MQLEARRVTQSGNGSLKQVPLCSADSEAASYPGGIVIIRVVTKKHWDRCGAIIMTQARTRGLRQSGFKGLPG